MSLEITNVRLATVARDDGLEEQERLYTVVCEDGKVRSVHELARGMGGGPESRAAADRATTDAAEDGRRGVEDEDDTGVAQPEGEGGRKREVLDGEGGLLLPSLCHSHIHIDKCYILDKGAPLVTGDFAEALRTTARVKAGFPAHTADLLARGDRLVRASVEAGVTRMRAHVEVDRTVGAACLRAALRLKAKWVGVCDVLICVFMQDALFDGAEDDRPGENARHLSDALSEFCSSPTSSTPSPASTRQWRDPNTCLISAVGSAPYVERTRAQQLANIAHIVALAQAYGLHVDFHLDYDLKPLTGDGAGDKGGNGDGEGPLIWSVLDVLEGAARARTLDAHTAVAIGHATRLTRFPPSALLALRARVAALPCAVHFIGLPQSDLYMMGRRPPTAPADNGNDDEAYDAPRGTLNAVRLRGALGCANVALAVNNVGNAFTPQGAPDPLALCPLGVAVYQDGTPGACRVLLEAITVASKHAIGIDTHSHLSPGPSSGHSTPQRPVTQSQSQTQTQSLRPTPGCAADFVLLHENTTVQGAALDPSFARTTVKDGRVVAWRRARRWAASGSGFGSGAEFGVGSCE